MVLVAAAASHPYFKRSIPTQVSYVRFMEMTRRRDARAASPSLALAILVAFASSSSVAFAAAAAPSPAKAPHSHTPHSLFSYEGSTGPDKWGSLQKEWAICRDGTKQSPIDISKVEVQNDMGPLKPTYKAGTAVVQNRGHDFMLTWKDKNSKLSIQGKEYMLQQVHWHVPSEHAVNGTRFDMEMHMVHEDSGKARAVVSVLFSTKAGSRSKLLADLGPYFKRLAAKENAEEEVRHPVDPSGWVDKASGYYRYEGSLTTPPCTEGVIWTIMSKVADASKEQIDLLESVSKTVEPNARPAQKLNTRVVRYYEAETKDGHKKSGRVEKIAPGPKSEVAAS